MKSRDLILLNKILEYCNQAEEARAMFNNEYSSFVEKSVFRNACCMCILQIGELCKLVSDDLKYEEKCVPWKSWCGIRDIFAHQYSNLDYQSAWETIQYDLPELKENIERIIKVFK